MRLAALLTIVALPAQAPAPAALAVGKDCFSYADRYTLVRHDALAAMDAAEENLPKCVTSLEQAQVDLQALNASFDKLQTQKAQLVEHIALLEKVLKEQREACAAGRSPAQEVGDAVGAAWEWADAPLAFAAGAGMCVGIAWGLNRVTQP